MTDLREELARAWDPMAWAYIDKARQERPEDHPALPITLADQIERANRLLPIIARVRAEERERCAKVADAMHYAKGTLVAAAIRALGDK